MENLGSATPGGRTSPPRPGAERPFVTHPHDGTTVIRTRGHLDSASGGRLLRLLDAEIEMARTGHRRLDVVVIDASASDTISRGGPEALAHALHACTRRRIGFAVAGTFDLRFLSPAAQRRLAALTWYPTVEVAITSATGRR